MAHPAAIMQQRLSKFDNSCSSAEFQPRCQKNFAVFNRNQLHTGRRTPQNLAGVLVQIIKIMELSSVESYFRRLANDLVVGNRILDNAEWAILNDYYYRWRPLIMEAIDMDNALQQGGNPDVNWWFVEDDAS